MRRLRLVLPMVLAVVAAVVVPSATGATLAPGGLAPTGPAAPAATGSIGASRPRTQPDTMPLPATSGMPKVEVRRAGVVVATYASLGVGGPFQRSHAWNELRRGDEILVYPAVYEGPGQYPWIGPRSNSAAEYDAGITHPPTGLTIRGVTVGGRRPVIRLGTQGDANVLGHAPVEIEGARGLTITNIDIDGTGGSWVDRAGIYVIGSRDVTLRDMRIHGFRDSQHNGVFAAGASSGTLLLDDLRLDDNGGTDGPAHNVYVNESSTDPDYTLKVTRTWSSASTVGHLLKSRAQQTVVTGNLLQGIDAPAGWDCAESYDLDVPNGGRLLVRDNVLVKGRSGACGNGVLLRYAAEGADAGRTHSVTIDHNTFVATSPTYDAAGHLNVPMLFYSPAVVPDRAGWPAATPFSVRANRFEGFTTTGAGAAAEYRGGNYIDVPG